MNTITDTLALILLLAPLAAGAWAAWWLPRWAGEGRPGRGIQHTDWSVANLPSEPYARLPRLP